MKKLAPILLLLLLSVSMLSAQKTIKSITVEPWDEKHDKKLKEDKKLIKNLSNENLIFKSGLIITASQTEFGGLSALWVSEDGEHMISITDYENNNNTKPEWFKFKLKYTKSRNLDSATFLDYGQLKNSKNQTIDGAIESMAVIDDDLFLSLDNSSEILNYDFKGGVVGKIEKSNVQLLPVYEHQDNCGIETLTNTKSKFLLAIDEMGDSLDKNTNYRNTWLTNPKTGSVRHFKYYTTENEVKGATKLQNGDIILIEKTFFKENKKTRLKFSLIKDQDLQFEILKSETLLKITSVALDNFEGIASYYHQGKQYILIVSDDNGNWNNNKGNGQRTLLLHFELKQ